MSDAPDPTPPKVRGGRRQQRQYKSLEAKLAQGVLTREQLAANPSKSLFALGLSGHPETGLWIGEPTPPSLQEQASSSGSGPPAPPVADAPPPVAEAEPLADEDPPASVSDEEELPAPAPARVTPPPPPGGRPA